MADNAPSPTPSEDNKRNERDDLMSKALDNIMNSQVQTYDNFVDSFLFLKENKPELVPSLAARKKQAEQDGTASTSQRSLAVNDGNCDGPVKSTRNIVNDIKRRRLGKIITGNTSNPSATSVDLETEVLEEGEVTSRLSGKTVIKTGSIKVDNFVEEEDDDIEEVSDYSASFSTGRARPTLNTASLQDSDRDVANLFDSKLNLDESSTDRLLQNFLADLQNETNEGKSGENVTESGATSTDSGDIQSFINRNVKPGSKQMKVQKEDKEKGVKAERNKETEGDTDKGIDIDSGDDVNFDDDDCDDAIDLCEDNKSTEVHINIKPGELEEIEAGEKTDEERRKEELAEIYKSALMDSEGVVRTNAADRMDREVVETAREEEEKQLIFPGQVEDSEDNPVFETTTVLEFKATYREGSSGDAEIEQSENTETTTDEIEPFQLDENFDYDNVVLTPKFTVEEINRFRSNLPVST